MKYKLFAFYLPQFHETQENNLWWGKGFTEWDNVRKAKPFLKSQSLPRVPLNNNYYDLSKLDTLILQGKLAREFLIEGFSIYHYWSKGVRLLQKPLDLILQNKEIDFPFHLTWANHPWVRSWRNSSGNGEILFNQQYEETKDEREIHFSFLDSVMRDKRYNRIDGKLLLNIYKPSFFPNFNEYISHLRDYIYQKQSEELQINAMLTHHESNTEWAKEVDKIILFQPGTALNNTSDLMNDSSNLSDVRKHIISYLINEDFYGKKMLYKIRNKFFQKPRIKKFGEISELIIKQSQIDSFLGKEIIPGAFVDWDNTPRYGKYATVIQDSNPLLFAEFLSQIKLVLDSRKISTLFINAWNEWGECAYLEPDDRYGYEYLEAIKKIFNE